MTTSHPDLDLRLGRWQEALADVTMVDALIVDAPYSDRTHRGHDSALTVDGQRHGRGSAAHETRPGAGRGRVQGRVHERRTIDYSAWTPADVAELVTSWAPRCRGWMVSITDHVLMPAWIAEMERAGRYVFHPLVWLAKGSRVRLTGDGPACWTCWIIVSRPRSGAYRDGTAAHKWGSLHGGYDYPTERAVDTGRIVGGKPMALMQALIRDYTRPGDLVVDPCAGGGTTLIAAAREGRQAVGSEVDADTYGAALKRIDRLARQAPLL